MDRPAISHRVGVVLVLDAKIVAQRGVEELGHVAGREDVLVSWCEAPVHADAIADLQPGGSSQFDVRPDAEPGHNGVGDEFLPVLAVFGDAF